MAKLKHSLIVTGTTLDGVPVISGNSIFSFEATYGLPLEFILISIKDRFLVDWIGYLEATTASGKKLKTTILSIEFAVKENYGELYSKQVIDKINKFIETSIK